MSLPSAPQAERFPLLLPLLPQPDALFLFPLPDGRLAQVFYVPCAGEETEIQLPEGCCQVSGDNAGGFIVTAWGRPA